MEHLQSTILIDILATFCSGIVYFFVGTFFSVKRNHYKKLQKNISFYEDKALIGVFLYFGCVFFPLIHVLMISTLFLYQDILIFDDLNVSTVIGIAYMLTGMSFVIYLLRRRRQAYIFDLGNYVIFNPVRLKREQFVRVDFTRKNCHIFLSYLDENKAERIVCFKNRPRLQAFFEELLPKSSIVYHRYTNFK